MLEKKTQTKILELVRSEPKTIQDIAHALQKNWRTADRYVAQITLETGLIQSKIFRGGTRAALKVVYWNALEPGKMSAYQERLLQRILHSQHKEDFSPFDIYQFAEKRQSLLAEEGLRFEKLLTGAQQQILFFSGNLSWLDTGSPVLQKLAQKKIQCKILTRIDFVSQEKVRTLLAMNTRFGRDFFEIRHCDQALRGMIIDDTLLSLKETLSPLQHRELKKNVYLSYVIQDQAWIVWMQQVFWQLWHQSIDAQTRLKALKEIHH